MVLTQRIREVQAYSADDSEGALEEHGGLRLAEQAETGRSRAQGRHYPAWKATHVEASLVLDVTCESQRSPEKLRLLRFAAQARSGWAVLEPGGREVVNRCVGTRRRHGDPA